MSTSRCRTLDAARGLAVLLMIVDHVWLAWSLPAAWLVRKVLTRPALPLFMVVSGILWARHWSWRRRAVIFISAAISIHLAQYAGLPIPDILPIYAIVQLCAGASVRWPLVVNVLSVLQASEWRLGWPNYEPGTVLSFCCIGVMLGRGRILPECRCAWLEWVGRYPLAWYLGHLAALALWKALVL